MTAKTEVVQGRSGWSGGPGFGGSADDKVNTVLLAFRVLEHLVQVGGSVGVTETALRLGETKTRLFRTLRTLASAGYVAQESSGRYAATSRVYLMGQAYAGHHSLVEVARPVLEALRDRSRQTATIGEVEPEGVRILFQVRAASAIEITTPVGALMAFDASAQGLIALAFGPAALLERLRGEQLASVPERSPVSLEALEQRVVAVRRQGWAVAPGSMLAGVNALAFPIMNDADELIGTVGIVGSIDHVPPSPSPEQLAAVRDAAGEIASAMRVRRGAHPWR